MRIQGAALLIVLAIGCRGGSGGGEPCSCRYGGVELACGESACVDGNEFICSQDGAATVIVSALCGPRSVAPVPPPAAPTEPAPPPPACAPDCTGRACGDDGCGGDCGDCPGEPAVVCGADGSTLEQWAPLCSDGACGYAVTGAIGCDYGCLPAAASCCEPWCGDACDVDDGCGGVCVCPAGAVCVDGACVEQ